MDILLQSIKFPADLRILTEKQLAQVANELRSFLLSSIAKTGGHLGCVPQLLVVE